MVANQIRPPGFPPMQNHQNNQNRGNNFNQNQGNNFNQGQIYPPQNNRPSTFQASPYQAPAPAHPTPGVSMSDFDNYVKANDAVMQNMQNQMANITDLITKFMNSNTASTSGSGSLPSNTIANPKGDMKAITTRSGVSYNEPQISSPPKEKENETQSDKGYVQPSTKKHPTPVVQIMPNCSDAHHNMPKFAPMFRKLLNDKDKMIELTKTPVNENCSAVILKKFPEKLGDPGRFLIPCDFPEMNECLALADLGASINLMPLSIWKELNFVVPVDYVADPRVPLILGRPFLRTARALIDVHGEQMTLRHDDQSVTFKVGDTKTFSYNIIESVNRVDVIDIACEEYVQEVLEISESGNPTSTSDLFSLIEFPSSPSFTPFGGSDFLMEEIDEFLEHDDSIPPGVDGIYDSEGDTVYLEELLNPPDLELKDLPSHLEYAFLEGDDKLPVIIAKNLKDEDKTALIKDCPDCEDSRALSFVFHPQEFHILSFILGIHEKNRDDKFIRQDIRRLFYGRFSFYDPNVDKIKEVKQERIFKKKAKRPNQARDGKDKVNLKPKSVKSQKSSDMKKSTNLRTTKTANLKLYYKSLKDKV
ncbi:hypothetical protein Tco_0454188 [Tanacetum coccineum]